jgi:hypothetical protein
MTCPRCGFPGKDPRAIAKGSKGGLATGRKKGFGSPHVLAKALATRRRNAQNAPG